MVNDNKVKTVILFDVETRLPISSFVWYETWEPVESVLYKICTIDCENQKWCGTYDSGKIGPLHEKATIYETLLDTKCRDQILKAYPIEKQLKILYMMLKDSDIKKTEDFLRMVTFIDETRKVNNNYKTTYAHSDRVAYKTEKQEIETFNEKMNYGKRESSGKHDIDKLFLMDDLL